MTLAVKIDRFRKMHVRMNDECAEDIVQWTDRIVEESARSEAPVGVGEND